jgi:hypothetical protein
VVIPDIGRRQAFGVARSAAEGEAKSPARPCWAVLWNVTFPAYERHHCQLNDILTRNLIVGNLQKLSHFLIHKTILFYKAIMMRRLEDNQFVISVFIY